VDTRRKRSSHATDAWYIRGGYVCTWRQAGDCVVAFSRRDIFDIKTEIERLTTMRCCVVYGALPPETRRMQVTGRHK
jgi:hypothetical protein